MKYFFDAAKSQLRRVECFPVSSRVKAELIATLVVPKATSGCGWRFSQEKLYGLQVLIHHTLVFSKRIGAFIASWRQR
jgi:hypothetical protein